MGRLAALVLLVAAGCGASRPAGALTEDELGWIRDSAEWSEGVYENLAAAGGAAGAALTDPERGHGPYLRRLRVVGGCAGRFAARVGDPPTRRLAPGATGLLAACRHIARYARAEARSLRTLSPDDFLASQEELSAGFNGIREARRTIGRLLWDARPVPRRAGLRGESRIDPLLSDTAARFVGRGVEARCWSADDWPRVAAEMAAFTGGDITVENTGAFAYAEDDRVHLQAGDCDLLVRLAGGTAGRDDEFDLAWALLAYTHELQHLVSERGDEAATECAALQTAGRLAGELGVPAAMTRRLVRRYLADGYDELPDEYRSPECRDGGALDLDPGAAHWP